MQVDFVAVHEGGWLEWWIKNLTWDKDNRKPSVQKVGMYWILNYAHRVDEINNMNTTVIKHKFSVGDTVWLMHDNKPYSQRITDMDVSYHKNVEKPNSKVETCVRYLLYGNLHDVWFYENQLFATKDELLDSLR